MTGLPKLLDGKNVLITGAGRNIGLATAVEMGAHGAAVYFTDRDETLVKTVTAQLRESGTAGAGFVSDIRKSKEIDLLCSTLENTGVHIDILVNNVGRDDGVERAGLDSLEPGTIGDLFDTNFFGPLELTRRMAQSMTGRGEGGVVLFLTSIHQWAVRGMPGYSASKAALGMIVKELAFELAPERIRVNAIAPGWVTLDKTGKPVKHEYAPLYKTSIDPCFIARAALFLASEHFSRHTTGTVLKVDGGLSLYNHIASQFPDKP